MFILLLLENHVLYKISPLSSVKNKKKHDDIMTGSVSILRLQDRIRHWHKTKTRLTLLSLTQLVNAFSAYELL
jgi:hypothetical protein